jgi:hypothetical protein
LNDIFNIQRSPNDKARLGYDQNSTSTTKKMDKRSINYSYALRNPSKKEDNKMKMTSLKTIFNKKTPHPKLKGNTNIRRMVSEGKGNTIIRRNPPNRYQHIFLGYCYSCNNFGHKEVCCKAYIKYKPNNVQRYKNKNKDAKKINYNSFSPLQEYNVECHK